MTHLPDIELSTLQPEELALAAGVAARGMRDNPSTIAFMGDDPVRRARAIEPVYQWVLSSLQRPCLVARRQRLIVGIAAMAPPDLCFYRQMLAQQKGLHLGDKSLAVAVPFIPWNLVLPLVRIGPTGLSRISRWADAGVAHDPAERHQHVELVVVEAALQGLGIGSQMMEGLCRDMDQVGEMSYLETDKEENIRFYQRFGFEVTGESTVLGITNWYMQRLPTV